MLDFSTRYWYNAVMTETIPALVVAAASDTGLVRRNNEDGVWLVDRFIRCGLHTTEVTGVPDAGVLLAVADGVGGAAAGEVASRWVCEQMAGRIFAASLCDTTTTPGRLQRIASEVNADLLRESEADPHRRGMATTWTAVLMLPSGTFWLNAGDSRLYRLTNGELDQVSRDHTLREERGDPSIPGNIISNCFGNAEGFYLDVGELDLASCDGFLLCTDGLSDYADFSRAHDVVRATEDPQTAAQGLLRLALDGGGGDNVTLIFARRPHG